MTGPSAVDCERPNPTGEGGWLTDKAWAGIIQLSKNIEAFKYFDLDFEKHIEDWEKIYNSPNPSSPENPWPSKWNSLKLFRKIIILRIIRPGRVVPAIMVLIQEDEFLGIKYI